MALPLDLCDTRTEEGSEKAQVSWHEHAHVSNRSFNKTHPDFNERAHNQATLMKLPLGHFSIEQVEEDDSHILLAFPPFASL
jgi:hypothetical protein